MEIIREMKEKIQQLYDLYKLSKTKGFTLLEWHRAVDLLREVIDGKRGTLDKFL